jgi:hypothetical protein
LRTFRDSYDRVKRPIYLLRDKNALRGGYYSAVRSIASQTQAPTQDYGYLLKKQLAYENPLISCQNQTILIPPLSDLTLYENQGKQMAWSHYGIVLLGILATNPWFVIWIDSPVVNLTMGIAQPIATPLRCREYMRIDMHNPNIGAAPLQVSLGFSEPNWQLP